MSSVEQFLSLLPQMPPSEAIKRVSLTKDELARVLKMAMDSNKIKGQKELAA